MTPLCRLLTVALAALPLRAHAAPPAEGSEDWQIMHPYEAWIMEQHDDMGRWCCNIADGRPVQARTHRAEGAASPQGDHWQIFAPDGKFENVPAGWYDVPPDRVLPGFNPLGVPIAWVIFGLNPETSARVVKVLCFHPGSGT